MGGSRSVCCLVACLMAVWAVSGLSPGQERDKGDTGHGQASGRWKLVYDYKVDGELKPDEGAFAHVQLDIRGNQASGKFDEPRLKENRSIFTGEFIHGKEGTILILRETGQGRPSVYIGRLVAPRKFAGTYLESKSDGLAGEFELTYVGK